MDNTDSERRVQQPPADGTNEPEQVLELREEELVPHKELKQVGTAQIRTEIEEFPGQVDVDALREDVIVEHEPIDRVVEERRSPWEEDGALVVPVYEERLVVTKQLVLREQLRVRRVSNTEHKHFEDTLKREHAIVEDPDNTGLVREQDVIRREPVKDDGRERTADQGDGLIEKLVMKVLK